ncbi:MAG: TetR/AcrR family transcriptional regulator [Deltaproteobacteria bacterium]|nr:TetR/AcrR family transcriptional regulator [Deltaproteobacteria bacterium]
MILEATWKVLGLRKGAPFNLDEVAKVAKVSRQGLYLHYGTKTELFLRAVAHMREKLGYDDLLAGVASAATADAALATLLDAHVELTPRFMRAARALEAERVRDPAMEAAFAARKSDRRELCGALAQRLAKDRRLAAGWAADDVADLLWVMTSAGVTEDLLVRRGWTHAQLRKRLGGMCETFLKK